MVLGWDKEALTKKTSFINLFNLRLDFSLLILLNSVEEYKI